VSSIAPDPEDDGMAEVLAFLNGDPAVVVADLRTAFAGKTYEVDEDFARLAVGVLGIYLLLLDGLWHSAMECKAAIGQERWQARIGDLRTERWGPLEIERERDPNAPKGSGAWRTRLILGSVTPEIHARILSGKPVPVRKKTDAEKALAKQRKALKRKVTACSDMAILEACAALFEASAKAESPDVDADVDALTDFLDD